MPGPTAKTEAGAYRGASLGDTGALFRGIRYAAPPIGRRRWAPPEPPESFDGVRDALGPGPACPQPPGGDAPYRAAAKLAGVDAAVVAMNAGPTGEDCLCLDLWTPRVEPDARLPVMVWIHGGASVWGSGSDPMFDGSRLAVEHGVVVVSINYRLGVLGFLAHRELVDESPLSTAGNYGFLDQVAALRWVQRNVSAFGGDPTSVTVFGESAGGRAVFELLAHPGARGLFHRAIAQSPWDESHHHRRLDESFASLESALAIGDRLAGELGIEPGDQALERLRASPVKEVLDAAGRIGFPGSIWGPIVDGVVFPDHPLALVARGETAAVPLLLGSNADEATVFFLDELPFPTAASYGEYVAQTHPQVAEELLKLYPPGDDELQLHRSFSALYGDRTFVFPGLLAAKAMAERAPFYFYRFTHAHPPFADSALRGKGRRVGAFHASEIPLVFGTLATGPLDEHDEPLGDAMRGYWARFAATGDPNDGGRPAWPAFLPEDERYLELGDRIEARARPLAERYPVLLRALGDRLGLAV